MIIYNETYMVDESVNHEWLNWVKQNHIPAVIGSKAFDSYQILEVLNSPNEGVTYCIQYFTDSFERYDDFMLYHLNPIAIAHNQQFENRFVLFNTLMRKVYE